VLRECLIRAPREANCLLIRAALLVDRGEVEQAEATIGQLRTANPEFSLAAEREYRRFGNTPLMERFLAALARAQAPGSAARSPVGAGKAA